MITSSGRWEVKSFLFREDRGILKILIRDRDFFNCCLFRKTSGDRGFCDGYQEESPLPFNEPIQGSRGNWLGMKVINEVFVWEAGWFFYEVVGKEVRIGRFLSDDFRVEGAKIMIIQFRGAISFQGDINRLVGPIDPGVVFLEPRHTEDDVFFTTICDIEQDFVGDSANVEEKCGRKLNFSTRVDRGVDVVLPRLGSEPIMKPSQAVAP